MVTVPGCNPLRGGGRAGSILRRVPGGAVRGEGNFEFRIADFEFVGAKQRREFNLPVVR